MMARYPKNHTPGPWVVERKDDVCGGGVVHNWVGPTGALGDGRVMRVVAVTDCAADALLIAAAPELVQTLSDLLMWVEDNCDEDSQDARLRELRQRSEALISKAYGWPDDE